MTRSHGRYRRGKRLQMEYPHGHRKTTTLVAGLRTVGMVAPMVLDGRSTATGSRPMSEDARDAVRALVGTDAYIRARRRRQRIERIFSHLQRTWGCVRSSHAAQEFAMAAAAYNLQLLARRSAPA